ncbi:MAG: hypothetical protein Q7V01_15040, partial [Vicinamibacterales bacterium]|nr:hypothetical protein [Vicinamibacterales bacterium]
MNRLFKGIVAAGLTLVLTAAAVPLSAQDGTRQPSESRMAELLAHARQTYTDGAVQGSTPAAQASGQQDGRPVMRLSVDDAVTRALENNIELSVERLNPQLQDLSLAQVKAAYRPTLNALSSMSSNMPLPNSLLTGGT